MFEALKSLEILLNALCSTVTETQSNAQQTLYLIGDGKEAQLVHEMLSASGIDNKYYPNTPDNDGGKLYVQNASVAAHIDALADLVKPAILCKKITQLVDESFGATASYQISYNHTLNTRHIALHLPHENQKKSAPSPAAVAVKNPPSAAPLKNKAGKKTKTDEDSLLDGPAVARAAIPASMRTSATEEDPLRKRIFFYLTGRAFTSGAWLVFIALILGVVFSVIVTVKAFLCPDLATDQKKLPSYCPQKIAPQKEQQKKDEIGLQ